MSFRKTVASALAVISLFAVITSRTASAQTGTPLPSTLSDSDSGPDPALVNLAPMDGVASAQPNTSTPPTAEDPSYTQQPTGSASQSPADSTTTPGVNDPSAGDGTDDQADQPPPPLFDYDQPTAPGPYFFWCPGYWAHSSRGFFWVPGQWARAPFYGALWTPPYWSWSGSRSLFHHGYWAHHIGFYGGINYGFGYIGTGYFGGYWRGRDFYYNLAVTSADTTTIPTVYTHAVTYNGISYSAHSTGYTSYNGGPGGLSVLPTPAERAVARGPHMRETAPQETLSRAFAHNPEAAYSQNQGHPARAAMNWRSGSISSAIVLSHPSCPDCLRPAETMQQAQQKDEARRIEIAAHHAQAIQRIGELSANRPTMATSATSTSTTTGLSSNPTRSITTRTAERRPSQPQPAESRIERPAPQQPAEPVSERTQPTETEPNHQESGHLAPEPKSEPAAPSKPQQHPVTSHPPPPPPKPRP